MNKREKAMDRAIEDSQKRSYTERKRRIMSFMGKIQEKIIRKREICIS